MSSRAALVLIAVAVSVVCGGRAASARDSQRTDHEIYSVSVDGKVRRDLSRGASDDTSPTVAANGRRIAFLRWFKQPDDPRQGLWLMNADGSRKRKVPGTETFSSPVWSPDGTRIAASASHFTLENPYKRDVKILRLADSHVTTIEDASDPTWSPDGTRLAYLSEAIPSFRSGWRNLSVADADGSNSRVVFRREAGLNHQPVWAPRGNWIALTIRDSGFPLHLLDDETELEQEVAREGWNPTWSPDGSRLAFAFYGGIAFTRVARPVTYKLVGNYRHGLNSPRKPAWSPDGRRIAFITKQQLRVIDVVTRRVRVVARSSTGFSAPVWSPDGRRLYYVTRFPG